MRRKAFTLLELLVIIALLGILAAVATMTIQKGRDVARLKGSVRDVFATIRIARSIALVSQQPSVIVFSTKNTQDGCVSHVEIVSTELVSSSPVQRARTVEGDLINLSTGETVDTRQAFVVENRNDATPAEDGGETVEEILFAPVSDEVFDGIRLKVVMDDETVETPGTEPDEAKKSMISSFSNVDFLLGTYREERQKKKEADAEREKLAQENEMNLAEPVSSAGREDAFEKSLAWQVNGRCDPHTVFVYVDGTDFTDGWKIKVDRFGAARILSPEEAWR